MDTTTRARDILGENRSLGLLKPAREYLTIPSILNAEQGRGRSLNGVTRVRGELVSDRGGLRKSPKF